MRTIVGIGMLLLCPLLVGCSLFRDKRGDSAKGDGARPFTGTPTSRLPERAEAAPVTPSVYSGVLAGYVLDRFNRPMSNAFILVVDLNDTEGKSKIDVAADERGQFAIPRLTAGHTYKLIARVKDGTRTLAGLSQATAPNPKINIVVSEDFVDKDTPPIPPPLGTPIKPTEPAEKEKEKEKEPTSPAAGLGAPIRTDPGTSETGTRVQPPVVVPGGPPDKSRIAKDVEEGGFVKSKPEAPKVFVPGPGDSLPPAPPRTPREEERPPPKPEPEPTTTDPVPGAPTPVPSCILIGKKLENFALFDLEGKPWEFRKERKGRLVLLQFWSSTNPESLQGLRNLRDLQATYGTFGLQVIGIAYEEGPWVQQVQNVRSARGRHVLNYVTLLGGGGQGSCPVRDQFAVEKLPELVLVGEDGQIVWRSRGAPDADRLTELRLEIKKRLGVKEP